MSQVGDSHSKWWLIKNHHKDTKQVFVNSNIGRWSEIRLYWVKEDVVRTEKRKNAYTVLVKKNSN